MKLRARRVLVLLAVSVLTCGVAAAFLLLRSFTCVSPGARADVSVLRSAVQLRLASRESNDCPSIAQLKREQFLDSESPEQDPWGGPYRIECDGLEARVSSSGPDRRWQTNDDVRAPRARTDR